MNLAGKIDPLRAFESTSYQLVIYHMFSKRSQESVKVGLYDM